MADAPSRTEKAQKELDALRNTVTTVLVLIAQLRNATKSPNDNPTTKQEGQKASKQKGPCANALDLSHDASSLLKAHSTKISLLIINKPFTATAVSTVLREIAAGPLPALASAVEICNAASYTTVMAKEMQWRVEKVLVEFTALVNEIPLDGKILDDDQKNGTGNNTDKGSLASTGVLWQACEDLMSLKKLGVAGLVIKKAEQYRDTLKDALEELQEWGEEEDDEDGELADELADAHLEEVDAAQKAIDDMFGSQRHIPKNDTDKIRERLDSSVKRLRLITLMYQAVIKRRFKSLPALPHPDLPAELKAKSNEDPGIIQTLDEVLNIMRKIPDITDELANGFYELDTTEIDKRMDEVFFTGFAAAELLLENWEGQKDEFTTWAQKFQLAMKKGW